MYSASAGVIAAGFLVKRSPMKCLIRAVSSDLNCSGWEGSFFSFLSAFLAAVFLFLAAIWSLFDAVVFFTVMLAENTKIDRASIIRFGVAVRAAVIEAGLFFRASGE